jgi:Tol biopolymer transport system component
MRTGSSSLKVVRADGSDPRTLASDVAWSSADCATDLAWSPDGTHVAFARLGGAGGVINQVEIVAIIGGDPRVLVEHAYSPSWSPDGSTIAYVNDLYLLDPDGRPATLGRGISLVPASGGEPRPLSRAAGRRCAFDEPQWSSDGQHIAYQALEGAHDVYVARADGAGELAITSDDADESWPRWSPDDSRIAFERTGVSDSDAPRIVVSDPNGGGQVELEHPRLMAGPAVWSPDGSRLLGVANDADGDGSGGLVVIDPKRMAAPVIIDTGHVGATPAWQRLAP